MYSPNLSLLKQMIKEMKMFFSKLPHTILIHLGLNVAIVFCIPRYLYNFIKYRAIEKVIPSQAEKQTEKQITKFLQNCQAFPPSLTILTLVNCEVLQTFSDYDD